MKLITFLHAGKERTGVLSDAAVLPFRGDPSLLSVIKAGVIPSFTGEALSPEDVRLLAPIPRPEGDIICLGMNFMDHTEEAARFDPVMLRENKAVYFSKRTVEATPPGGKIPAHRDLTRMLDYEAEVAFILGRDAAGVSPEEARDCVFGYTILNDVSARDLQTAHKQFYFGKSLDGFTPMGPCVVTADEFAYPPDIPIRCYVNGEKRQDGSTRQWVFSISDVLCELSRGMTLKSGTIISMGTPAGVGMGFSPPKYLQPGDTVRCEADGIGVLENTVE